LKALGLKSGRVLRIMLIESTIVGLLSAGLGLGLSSLIISIFSSYTGTTIPLPVESRGVAVALVVASVLIGWVSTFLSANVAVRERVMNVLRYE
jgi:ABC-type antimicrobial peptide transport system permease subunit